MGFWMTTCFVKSSRRAFNQSLALQIQIHNYYFIVMSSEDYNKRNKDIQRRLKTLKKDIKFRQEQVAQNVPTHTLDAQIRAQFTSIDQDIKEVYQTLKMFEKSPSQYGLMSRDLEERRKAYRANEKERENLKKMYDTSLTTKIPGTMAAQTNENMKNFNNEYKDKATTKEDQIALKKKLEQQQEGHIDNMMGAVKVLKTGQNQIGKELDLHDELLDKLDKGMDKNMQTMSKGRRNMEKLLQKSSYCCLIIVIIIEIAGIVCNLVLWTKD